MSAQPTHGDWERAKSRADIAAYQCTLEVLSGNVDRARDYAVLARAFTEEMRRLGSALDCSFEPSVEVRGVPGMEADGHAPADQKPGNVTIPVPDSQRRELVLLQSLDDRLSRLVEIAVWQVVGKRVVADVTHESSPSVGSPSGAACDNPNPTDGEPHPGQVSSPHSAAPALVETEVQE